MSFPVDNIRAVCKKRGTTLAKLEKKLGIGNGVIAKWEKTKGYPPYDRIVAIAEELDVPVTALTGEGQKEQPPAQGGELSADAAELIRLFDLASPELRVAALAVLKSAEAADMSQGDGPARK